MGRSYSLDLRKRVVSFVEAAGLVAGRQRICR